MISQNIRSLREHEGFTQEALASRLGVARQTVAKWESGEATPDLENVRALARLFGVSIDDLANHDEVASGYPIPPRGKHIFGVVRVGERGAGGYSQTRTRGVRSRAWQRTTRARGRIARARPAESRGCARDDGILWPSN